MRNQVRREAYWKPRPQSRLTQLVKSRESWHFGSVPRSVGLGKGLSNTPRHPDSKQCVRYGTYSGILGAAKHTVVTPTSPMPILGVAPHLALDNAGNACLELQGPTPTRGGCHEEKTSRCWQSWKLFERETKHRRYWFGKEGSKAPHLRLGNSPSGGSQCLGPCHGAWKQKPCRNWLDLREHRNNMKDFTKLQTTHRL